MHKPRDIWATKDGSPTFSMSTCMEGNEAFTHLEADAVRMVNEFTKLKIQIKESERDVLIEILACIGVLAPKSYDRPEAGKHDWCYATYWRGEDGYDRSLVDKYFRKYL